MKISLRFILLFFWVGFSFFSWGQEKLFYPQMDSISMDYRSDGHRLDSIDAAFIGKINLRPAAGFEEIYEKNIAKNIFTSTGGLAYKGQRKFVEPKFTGLPYLGFEYAFGSKLTQDLKVQYHQFFQPHTHFHLQYNRRTSNGFLRNGDYKLNDISLLFYHQKDWYATNLSGYYGGYDLGQNGGVMIDSTLQSFDLEFIPVQRLDARSKVRKLDLKWNNYFRLIGDSTVSTGLKTRHRYKIMNREYTDQVLDLSILDTLLIPGDSTGNIRDQYQTMKFANGAGVYFSSPHFQIDASINYQHWRNQNLGQNYDTNEVFIHSNLWASLGEKLTVNNEFYFNIIGAIGEMKDYADIQYQIIQPLRLSGGLKFENLYPTPYQRFHQASYYQWKIKNLEMQQKLQIFGALRYGDTNFIQAHVIWSNINNGRYFIDGEWRQDTLDFVTTGAIQLKGALHLGKWSFYPKITYRFNSSNFAYQPEFSTMNRISFTTKLFKAQRLGMAIGVDVGYETNYQFMEYNNVLGLLSPIQTPQKAGGIMRLNAFFALSIDQFRFFVKAVHLSAIWENPKTRIDLHYPIMPFYMRLGITWDFFN